MAGLWFVVHVGGDADLAQRARALSDRLYTYAQRCHFELALPDGTPVARGSDMRWVSSLLHGLNRAITGRDRFAESHINLMGLPLPLNGIADVWSQAGLTCCPGHAEPDRHPIDGYSEDQLLRRAYRPDGPGAWRSLVTEKSSRALPGLSTTTWPSCSTRWRTMTSLIPLPSAIFRRYWTTARTMVPAAIYPRRPAGKKTTAGFAARTSTSQVMDTSCSTAWIFWCCTIWRCWCSQSKCTLVRSVSLHTYKQTLSTETRRFRHHVPGLYHLGFCWTQWRHQ